MHLERANARGDIKRARRPGERARQRAAWDVVDGAERHLYAVHEGRRAARRRFGAEPVRQDFECQPSGEAEDVVGEVVLWAAVQQRNVQVVAACGEVALDRESHH